MIEINQPTDWSEKQSFTHTHTHTHLHARTQAEKNIYKFSRNKWNANERKREIVSPESETLRMLRNVKNFWQKRSEK